MAQPGEKTIMLNRRARHEYFIEDSYEAGISLYGTEVKSLRQGKANMADAYAMVENGELILHNMHISPYEQGNVFNRDPLRERRLLMHKREIRRIREFTQQKGYSLIPLRLYLKGGLVKVEMGLARGKKLYDKRQSAAESDARRNMEQAFRRGRDRGE